MHAVVDDLGAIHIARVGDDVSLCGVGITDIARTDMEQFDICVQCIAIDMWEHVRVAGYRVN